jgi:DNA modification methylase
MLNINQIYCGDCLEVMKEIDDNSIDSVITSPPYYQLRDYGFDGQWGIEKTYQEYLNRLIEFMIEVKRVLKPEGTIWINLGDSYGTVSGAMRDGKFGKKNTNNQQFTQIEMIHKCLMLIPHRFAIRCIDELNLILRNDIIWAKRNGMPESTRDRFTKKHEFFFFFVKQRKYYFDLDGVREKYKAASIERYKYDFDGSFTPGTAYPNEKREKPQHFTKIPKESCETFGSPRARNHRNNGDGFKKKDLSGVVVNDIFNNNQTVTGRKHTNPKLHSIGKASQPNTYDNPNGKNPGDISDFWDIVTKPSNIKKHYATYNDDLISKPIVAGCPEGGVILDPFCGTGTTLIRALQLNRKFIGIDGKQEYVDIANKQTDILLSQGILI